MQPRRRLIRVRGVEIDAALYEKHRGALHRYATARIGPGEAEDVVSTVVVRVMERAGLRSLEDPLPYLLRSILNEVRTRHRWIRPGPLPEE